MTAADTVVIGAGPAGIGAALALGERAVVLEAAQDVAGLSASVELDGAVFDLGGHSFHTPHPHVRDLVFGALEMEEQRRDAWCWLDGEWVAYPFQKHVDGLADPALRSACLAGMAGACGEAESRARAAHFDAYLDLRFGRPLADLFMRPYNAKLWGGDLSRLAVDWTGERIAGPRGTTEFFDERGGRRTPLQADTTVAYPARGGFGEIFRALARQIADLRTGTTVRHIDPVRRRLLTGAGDAIGWRQIVATLPVPALLRLVAGVPRALLEAAARLEAVPVDLHMVVLEGRGPLDRQRVYCPGAGMPGHKVVLNHTSSRSLRDRPRHGILVESAGRPPSPAHAAADIVEALRVLGLISGPGDVRRVELRRLPYGYPVPSAANARIMDEVRRWLARHDILLAGRFAEWAYINADEALGRGLALGQRIDRGWPAVPRAV